MKKLTEEELKYYLEMYDIESIDEFRPRFYTSNLQAFGYMIEKKAIENLYNIGYTNEELIQIDNYNEIGIVEYVANDRFHIEGNTIIAEEE